MDTRVKTKPAPEPSRVLHSSTGVLAPTRKELSLASRSNVEELHGKPVINFFEGLETIRGQIDQDDWNFINSIGESIEIKDLDGNVFTYGLIPEDELKKGDQVFERLFSIANNKAIRGFVNKKLNKAGFGELRSDQPPLRFVFDSSKFGLDYANGQSSNTTRPIVLGGKAFAELDPQVANVVTKYYGTHLLDFGDLMRYVTSNGEIKYRLKFYDGINRDLLGDKERPIHPTLDEIIKINAIKISQQEGDKEHPAQHIRVSSTTPGTPVDLAMPRDTTPEVIGAASRFTFTEDEVIEEAPEFSHLPPLNNDDEHQLHIRTGGMVAAYPHKPNTMDD